MNEKVIENYYVDMDNDTIGKIIGCVIGLVLSIIFFFMAVPSNNGPLGIIFTITGFISLLFLIIIIFDYEKKKKMKK